MGDVRQFSPENRRSNGDDLFSGCVEERYTIRVPAVANALAALRAQDPDTAAAAEATFPSETAPVVSSSPAVPAQRPNLQLVRTEVEAPAPSETVSSAGMVAVSAETAGSMSVEASAVPAPRLAPEYRQSPDTAPEYVATNGYADDARSKIYAIHGTTPADVTNSAVSQPATSMDDNFRALGYGQMNNEQIGDNRAA